MGGEVSTLVKRAKSNDEELGAMDFNGESALNSEAVQALCQSLHANTHVRNLDFTAHTAAGGKAGGKQLGDMLKSNKTLQVLRLSKTALGDAGAEGLAAGLSENTALRTLDVRGCELGAAGVRAIALAVAKHTTLEELRLDDNAGGGGVHAALADVCSMLRENKSLRTLGLSGAGLTADDVALLVAAVQDHSVQLSLLDLGHNPLLGQQGAAAHLAALLSSPRSPQRTVLASTNLSAQAGTSLLESMRAGSNCMSLDLSGNTEITGAVLSDVHELFLQRAKEARERRAKANGDNDD